MKGNVALGNACRGLLLHYLSGGDLSDTGGGSRRGRANRLERGWHIELSCPAPTASGSLPSTVGGFPVVLSRRLFRPRARGSCANGGDQRLSKGQNLLRGQLRGDAGDDPLPRSSPCQQPRPLGFRDVRSVCDVVLGSGRTSAGLQDGPDGRPARLGGNMCEEAARCWDCRLRRGVCMRALGSP
jgi:hypothetical protein